MSYVFIQTEPALWTVGFYGPDDHWHKDSDHLTRQEAAQRVHYLNGGTRDHELMLQRLFGELQNLHEAVKTLKSELATLNKAKKDRGLKWKVPSEILTKLALATGLNAITLYNLVDLPSEELAIELEKYPESVRNALTLGLSPFIKIKN